MNGLCTANPSGSCKCKKSWCRGKLGLTPCGRCVRHCVCALLKKQLVPIEDTEEGRQPCKVWKKDGSCSSRNPWCQVHDGFCLRHCECKDGETQQPKIPVMKTPAPKRSNHARVLAGITEICENHLSTPQTRLFLTPITIENVASLHSPVESYEELIDMFPPELSLKNMPIEKLRNDAKVVSIIEAKPNSRRMTETIGNYLFEVSSKAASILLPGSPEFALRCLHNKLSRILSFDLTRQARMMHRIIKSLFNFSKVLPKISMTYRIVRAILVEAGSQNQLERAFEGMEPPVFAKKSRTNGHKDYNRMYFDEMDPMMTKKQLSRFDVDALERAVANIIGPHNVGMLAVSQCPGLKFVLCFTNTYQFDIFSTEQSLSKSRVR
jgi:hypothetical protein